MAKDYATINLAIWGDDDWLDLSPAAQYLYLVLWTHPQLSYCGAGEWHAGRIAAMAKGWTARSVEAAAAELSRELFLIIDTATEEFLLRSWIKHDGLWRKPNMAVSMANARAALASRTLRGVVVHEVKKIKSQNEAEARADSKVEVSGGWKRDAVKDLLSQKAVDPASLDPFTPHLTPPPTPPLTPRPTPDLTPDLTPALTVNSQVGVNPPPNPGPTPAPAPTPLAPSPKGGYVSPVGHQGDDDLPPPHCSSHPNGTERPCRACGAARERRDQAVKKRERDELAEWRERRANCQICGGTGQVELGEDLVAKCECMKPREARHA